jgi:heme exporter protein A
MTNYSVELQNLTKHFGRRLVFEKLNFIFQHGSIVGISGPNGSGKSTLVKIIAGLISPTKGKVIHMNDGKQISEEQLHNHIGFVSPYLFLYDEFTANENLRHFSNIRGIKYNKEKAAYLLGELNLLDRTDDLVRGYSSGMKQRLKFIFALLHEPELLIFDEPTSNLDNAGKEKIYRLIAAEGKDKLVLIASNEDSDLNLCGKVIEIEKFKKNDGR